MSADTRKLVTNENLSAFAERLAEKVPLKSDLPTKVSDLANDRGFTDNAGTITSVTINGVTTSSGGVNLGYLVAAENGKGLSSNDYTTAEKNKLAAIDSGAQANTIETVKVNGTALTPDGNKAVDVTVPTTVAELSDASNYALASDLDDYAQVSDLEDTEEVLTAAVTDLNSRLEDAEDAIGEMSSSLEMLQQDVRDFPTNVSEFDNDAGYINTESDPVFSASPAAQISTTDMAYWDGKQDPLTFDSVPTQNSTNPVTSGGLYTVITQNEYTAATALNDLNNRVSDLEEIEVPEVDQVPTENSTNAVSSGGVYAVIEENEIAIAASLSELNSKVDTIPENISDLHDDIGLATTSDLNDYVLKSDYEDDEEVIATAVNDLNDRVTDLEEAPSFTESDPVFSASPAAGITAADITNWNGKTSNTGTITGITMNGSSKGTSGVVDLGTIVTSESDPVFSASAAAGITSSDITNWNGKTSNTGTLTGVTFNGTSATVTNGVAAITATIPTANDFYEKATNVDISTSDNIVDITYSNSSRSLESVLAADGLHVSGNTWDFNSLSGDGTCSTKYGDYGIEYTSIDNNVAMLYFPNINGSGTLALTSDLPDEVTESTVSGWGFTKNAGTVVGSGLTANKLVLGNGTTNIKTSSYGVSTSAPTSSSDNTTIPTSKAVYDAIGSALTAALVYRGTIGSSGATVSALPATHAVGDVYVVSVAGTYAGKACEVGDYIICNTDGTSASDAHWNVVNGENQVDNKSASLAAAGSSATIATVDGTNLTVTTPSSWTGVDKTGTITGISMNGASKGTSGVVDLGTVITSETALSKGTTSGSGNAVTDISVSGHQITLTKGKTFLESFTETDPVFSASPAAGITASDITNWNSKTSNTGTLTGVKFNNTSATVSNGVASITATIPSKLSDLTDDVVSGNYLPIFSSTDQSVAGNCTGLNRGGTSIIANLDGEFDPEIKITGNSDSTYISTDRIQLRSNSFTFGSGYTYTTSYGYSGIEYKPSGGSSYTLSFPSASGTLALTSDIPSAVTESTVSGWGFTKNTGTLTTETDPVFSASAAAGITSADITNWNGKTSNTGTITGITMNGASKGTSGVVNLGTVITSETALSKGTTSGSGNAVTDISVSGHQITLTKGSTFLTEHQSIKTINNQTITGTGNVNISGLPAVTSSDNGKILQVVNGAWTLVSPISIYSGSESPSNSIGNDGDIYIQS